MLIRGNKRLAGISFWAVLSLSLLALAGILVLFRLNLGNHPSDNRSFLGIASVYVVIGAVILKRLPGNRIGMILAAIGMLFFLEVLAEEIKSYAQFLPLGSPLLLLIAQSIAGLWMLPFALLVLLLMIYPTGRILSPRWRWLAWLAVLVIIINILLVMIPPTNTSITNLIATTGILILFICLLLSVVPLILRYRQSRGIERQQIKWFVLTGIIVAISIFSLNFISEAIPIQKVLLDIVMTLLISSVPMAITIAIFKYRLWDIDILIRKTLVYGLLTATLALIYFGIITLLETISTSVLGLRSPVIIVLSTLAIAALFNPLRIRIQDLIDRRFYRKKYDAEKALADFAAAARNETDIECLNAALLEVVQETMQPERVSLWLRPQVKK